MAPFGPAASKSFEPEDEFAIRKMLSILRAKNVGTYLQQLEDIVDRLSQTRAPEYESGLVDLGHFLGADSLKPKSKGRCDAVWCWSNERWLALEAKSEQDPNELIPHWDIRQVNDQLRLLQGDREADEIPLGSATVLISPRHTLERAAHGAAEDHVFLVQLEEVESLAGAVLEAWKKMPRPSESSDENELRKRIGKCLRDHGVLPSIVVDKMTRRPIP